MPNPLHLVKDWAIEQVTAIHSVCSPLPVQTLQRH